MRADGEDDAQCGGEQEQDAAVDAAIAIAAAILVAIAIIVGVAKL